MLAQHVDSGADVTVGCIEVARREATGFGVMHIDADCRIKQFLEKPKDPPGMPGKPDIELASLGIYAFHTRVLNDLRALPPADKSPNHDFGKDLIPYVVKHGTAVAHRFPQSCVR